MLGGSSPQGFQIFIKTVTGRSLAFRVTYDQEVTQLKTLIFGHEGVEEDQQRLIFNGRHMRDWQRLADLRVGPGDTIRLLYGLRGGLSSWTREGKGYGTPCSAPSVEGSRRHAPSVQGEGSGGGGQGSTAAAPHQHPTGLATDERGAPVPP